MRLIEQKKQLVEKLAHLKIIEMRITRILDSAGKSNFCLISLSIGYPYIYLLPHYETDFY